MSSSLDICEPTSSNMISLLKKANYVKQGNTRIPNTESIFSGKVCILLFFGAKWCPPCRVFASVLTELVTRVNRNSLNKLEVIYASMDKSEEDMLDFLDNGMGNWPAFYFHSIEKDTIVQNLNIFNIPSVVTITTQGDVITTTGREEIQENGYLILKSWVKTCQEILERYEKEARYSSAVHYENVE